MRGKSQGQVRLGQVMCRDSVTERPGSGRALRFRDVCGTAQEGTGCEWAPASSAHPSTSPSSLVHVLLMGRQREIKGIKNNKNILAVPSCAYGCVVMDAAHRLPQTLRAGSSGSSPDTSTALETCWGLRAQLVSPCWREHGSSALGQQQSLPCTAGVWEWLHLYSPRITFGPWKATGG